MTTRTSPRENPNIPVPTPQKKPSDTLLKNFRATLEHRWSQFDTATLKEAYGVQDVRDQVPSFQQAKAAFDDAKAKLDTLTDDDALKWALPELESALKQLTDYLTNIQEEEKTKEYNQILADIAADFEALKKSVDTGKPLPKEANTPSKAPLLKPTAVATAGVASVASLVPKVAPEITQELKGALWEGMQEAQQEATKMIGKEVAEFKKNPVQKALWFLGFDKDSIVSGYKKAMHLRKHGDFMGRIGAVFSTILYRLMGKLFGIDLTKISLGGSNAPATKKETTAEAAAKEQKRKELERLAQQKNLVNNKIIESTWRFLMSRVAEREYDGFFSAAWEGLKDSTFGKDKHTYKNEIKQRAIHMTSWNSIKTIPIGSLLSQQWKNPDAIIATLNLKEITEDIDKVALKYLIESLSKNKSFIEQTVASKHKNWESIKTGELLATLYKHAGIGVAEEVGKTIAAIDFKNPTASLMKIKTMLFRKDENGKYGWILAEQINSLKNEWIDETVVTRFFLGSDWNQTIESFRTTLKNKSFNNPRTQSKLEQLTQKWGFSRDIVSLMKQVWLGEYTEAFDNWEKISMKELLSVYAITRWEANMNQLSQNQQTQVMLILWSMIAKKYPWEMMIHSLLEIVSKSDNEYMQRFTELIGRAMSKATYVFVMKSVGIADEAISALWALEDKNPALFYGTIVWIMAAIYIGFTLKGPIVAGWAIATLIYTATGIITIAIIAK